MTLSQERFLRVIAYISAFYTNFKFDLKDSEGNPSMQLEVWYDTFKNFDEEEFVSYIKSFCLENVYPPSSPAQILEYIKKKQIKSYIGLEGFNYCVEMWLSDLSNNEVDDNIKTKSLELFKTYQMLRGNIRRYVNSTDDYTKNQLKNEFINTYNENIIKAIDEKIKGLVFGSQNLIENKK